MKATPWRSGKTPSAPDHPDLVSDLDHLTVLYRFQGRYAEAGVALEALARDQREGSRSGPCRCGHGPRYPRYALLPPGAVQGVRGSPSAVRALAIYEKALDPGHPDTAVCLGNLALICQAQGRYGEAGALWQARARRPPEKALGPDHPNLAASLDSLASLYRPPGAGMPEGEALGLQALAIYEAAFGPDHADVATCLDSLASLYDEQGRYDEAEAHVQARPGDTPGEGAQPRSCRPRREP
ncbi:MAG: tetratricopeptide repeat protein [Candidatus Moduliflexus flocculans]|nr:tetratricopeptide repeat protein [Candidatus Moduliflexus flocculans]